MRRTRPWIGLPVVDEKTGHKSGEVCELLFTQEDLLYGLLLRPSGWFRSATALRFFDVAAFRPYEVVRKKNSRPVQIESLAGFRCMQEGADPILGKMLYSTDGTLYGEVADVYIGEDSDKIVGYEVSDGLFADLLSGRRFVSVQEIVRIGENVIVNHPPEPIPKSVH